jgi:arginine:agmatine antiporter
MPPETPPRASLGLAACTAIVVGNMVGSGFYLSPTALAPYGQLAILTWIVMGIGAICLGLTFARLAALYSATGGPYAFTRLAYGDFAGFIVAWGYWISIWASLPVIAVAFTGSLLKLAPSLQGNRPVAIAITLAAIWFVALTNLRGVKTAGVVAELTTYAKLVPFAAIALIGLFFIHPSYVSEFNPRSTIFGILIAALLYVLGTVVVFGVVPRADLVRSTAPFVDAARLMWGEGAAALTSVAVMVSSLGALNGWTLMMGQVPMAAAQDGLFPTLFGRLSTRGVPAIGIAVSAALATALVLVQVSGGPGFAAVYDMIVSLSTMAAVIPYVFCSLASGLVASRVLGGPVRRVAPVEAIAFAFSMFTVYGCGPKAVLYGLILLLFGVPVYVWQRREHAGIVTAGSTL